MIVDVGVVGTPDTQTYEVPSIAAHRRGIFSVKFDPRAGISNQIMRVVHSTIPTSIKSSSSLIIGFTHSLSATMSLPSTTNSFSFGFPSMCMQSILTSSQSLTQTYNVGVGSSFIPYHFVPWGGVHISPSFPSIERGSFPNYFPNPFTIWGGSMGSGFQSPSNSSSSTLFTLYGGFRSNNFTSSTVPIEGKPFHGQWNPMQGYFSLQGMQQGGNTFLGQNIPMQGYFPLQGGLVGGNPDFPFRN